METKILSGNLQNDFDLPIQNESISFGQLQGNFMLNIHKQNVVKNCYENEKKEEKKLAPNT